MSEQPPATPDSILRNAQQQMLLLLELQERRQVISVPRDWLSGWYAMLSEAIRLIHQGGPTP